MFTGSVPLDPAAARVLRGGGEMGDLMRRFDWASTPLGPVSSWPATLRTIVSILLSTRHPMFLWWGPELIQFYNDGYRQSLGPDRHPSALGQRGRECWAEIWPIIGQEVESIMAGGDASWHEDHLVPITRGERVFDVYWSYSYSPVHDDNGAVGGILVTVQETTQRVLAERRKQLLRLVGERVAGSFSEHEVAMGALLLLDEAPDLPCAAIYLRDESVEGLHLAGHKGMDTDALPRELASVPSWPLAGCPGEVREGMVVPLARAGEGEAAGYLIAGANPRLALDEAYRAFIEDLGRILAAALDKVRALRMAQRSEQELRNAERLQAVGALAGGVAHEVNNQMTVVLGFGDFVLNALGTGHAQASADMRHVIAAGARAAKVSQQLLTFTRQQVTQPEVLDLGASVQGLAPVLRQLLGSDIRLEVPIAAGDTLVSIDPVQFEQVMINLAANARDAIPGGGSVSITVERIRHDRPSPEIHEAVPPGEYILLAVADTGQGMDELTLTRIFDPFFTTKPVGKGTGLGLSMVYGIVKRHEGYVWAVSSPGRGTTMRLCFPAANRDALLVARPSEPVVRVKLPEDGITRTVWVVEDEPPVRELVARTLSLEGLRVVTAEDGAVAMRLLDRDPVAPHALITDLVMPYVSGRQVSEAITARYRNVAVLFMSGYTSDEVLRRGLLPEKAAFLQKPFTRDDLVHALGSVLVGR